LLRLSPFQGSSFYNSLFQGLHASRLPLATFFRAFGAISFALAAPFLSRLRRRFFRACGAVSFALAAPFLSRLRRRFFRAFGAVSVALAAPFLSRLRRLHKSIAAGCFRR
jgi:hypothetical protein